MTAPGSLPTWPEIEQSAVRHLDSARNEMSEAANWLRAIDSPLTPAERQSAREALRIVGQVKNLIDEAKGMLQREGGRDHG